MMKQEMLALVALACLATSGAQEYRVPFGEAFEVPADATWARVYFQPIGKIEDFRVVSEGKEARR